jgi:pyruvate formate lyase activating enzyme
MLICGFQKLTLLDWPGKVACTVFTGGCNLRCPYCHNAGLVLRPAEQPVIDPEEVYALLEKRRGMIEGVCVTGGEPLLQPDLAGFIRGLRERGALVKLDTNGCLPDRLAALMDAGLLDYVAMDIKGAPEKYPELTGVPGLDFAPVERSVRLLMGGAVPYEFRTTVSPDTHAPQDFHAIGRLTRGARAFVIQGYKDSGDTVGSPMASPTPAEAREMLDILRLYVPSAELRGID